MDNMNLYDDSKTGSSRGRSSSSRGRAQSSREQAKGSSQRSSSQRSSSARSSASRQTSARRTASGYSGGRRGRRRRSQKNYMGIAVGGVILILLILIAAFAMKSCGGEETDPSAETESQISGEVTVDGVSQERLVAVTKTNTAGKYLFGGVTGGNYLVKAKLEQ